MKKSDTHTPIFGERTRPVQQIKVEDLIGRNDSVGCKGGYTISLNDRIVFPDRIEDFEIYRQPLSVNSTINDTLIAVSRNGISSYISLGSLYRLMGVGIMSQYTCEYGRRLGIMIDDYERVLLLAGNHIKCTRTEEGVFVKRDPATGKEIRPIETYTSKYKIIDFEEMNSCTVEGLLNSRLNKDKIGLTIMTKEYDVDCDGIWPYGVPIRRLYQVEINGLTYIGIEGQSADDYKKEHNPLITSKDLLQLIKRINSNVPIVYITRRPHLHNVAVCPIRQILPFIEEKEMWIETEFREDLVYDEKSIIEV